MTSKSTDARDTFPTQANLVKFYGNPTSMQDPTKASAVWESRNLVYVKAPFDMYYSGIKLIKGVKCHKLIAPALTEAFRLLWKLAQNKQSLIDAWGISNFSGCYNYRHARGSNWLSTHAFGAALDFDAPNNMLGDTSPKLAKFPEVIRCFESVGFTWGGRWAGKSCDGMHFQAARVK